MRFWEVLKAWSEQEIRHRYARESWGGRMSITIWTHVGGIEMVVVSLKSMSGAATPWQPDSDDMLATDWKRVSK